MQKHEVPTGSPCSLDWRKMTPVDGGRFCGECKKVVRDLSGMTEDEARALILGARAGELCVRYVYDAHGRIFFAGAQPAVLPASLLVRAKRAAAAAAAIALPLALQACHNEYVGGVSAGNISYDGGAVLDDAGDAGDAAPEGGGDAGGDARPDGAKEGGSDAGADADDAAPDASDPV